MSNEYADFDAYWDERGEPDPIRWKAFGRRWEIPGLVPAPLVLRIARLVKAAGGKEDASVPPTEVEGVAEDLFGREMLDEMLAHRECSIDRLGDMLGYVLKEHQARDNDSSSGDEDGDGDGPPPEGTDSTDETSSEPSSNDGSSSKPTSPGSTPSGPPILSE